MNGGSVLGGATGLARALEGDVVGGGLEIASSGANLSTFLTRGGPLKLASRVSLITTV